MKQTIIPVIISGGTGSRLWPISRESHPKPFIKLPDGESLLQKTLRRSCACADVSNIMTVTNKEYYLKSKIEYETAGMEQLPQMSYLLEPSARNTAPAVAIAALAVANQFGREAIMLIMPADHLITPVSVFVECCQRAFAEAANGRIVTFGIKPTLPETGYGYIECEESSAAATVRRAKRFVEKPTLETAESYIASGNYLWNSGMFCFQAGAILDQFAAHAPALLQAATACWQQAKTNLNVLTMEEDVFSQCENISLDYAIMEKSKDISVINCDFDWQDIGSWEAYKNLFETDHRGNTTFGDVLLLDSDNNFIHSENRMVASIGINNLTIIDTPDAMLITHRDRAQDVRHIVQTLKQNSHQTYLTHRTVIRPWGTYTVLEEGPSFKIKRIQVKPRASLSLQLHKQRSEHWVVVEGTAEVIIGEEKFTLQTNESTFVPMGTAHRLSNPVDVPLVMIEVQTGVYLGEDDIVRLEDTYGRV